MARPSPLRRSVTGRVLVVAHRGLSAEEPENTMRAFRRAAEAGCDLIELDVHLSRDGVPVVIHDETLERTTDGHGAVRDRTFDELRRLDAGLGERIPSLEEVLERTAVGLVVEIKQPDPVSGAAPYEGIAERVVALVRRSRLADRTAIISFDHQAVARVRDLWPDATTGVLYGGGALVDPLVLGRSADASGIHPWWTTASVDVCRAAHAAGLHVHGWGAGRVVRPEAVEALVRAGVDWLSADDVRELRRVLDALPSNTTVQ